MTNTNKLKALFVESGLTQAEVAEQLHITPQSLNEKINNKREFWASEIKYLISLFKLTPDRVVEIFFAV